MRNPKLIFTLKLLSDFHTSAGFGKGKGIDSALLRDSQGRLSIRGSTLSGLFRSTAEQLELQFGGDLPDLVQGIFGTPKKSGCWTFGPARLNVPDSGTQRSATMPNTRVRRGVRISPRLRRAEDQKLYSREFGAAGTTLTFSVERLRGGENDKDQAAILVAAARLIRGLGASVNRGAGRCSISLERLEGLAESIDQKALLRQFGLIVKGSHRSCRFARQQARLTVNNSPPLRYRVLVQGLEPMIISGRNQPGNDFITIDYIPGTTAWGALAALYLATPGRSADSEFLRIFRRGGLSVTPLYPVERRGIQLTPSIPVPQDILTCKHRGHFSNSPHRAPLQGFAVQEQIAEQCPYCAGGVPMVSLEGFIALNPTSNQVTPARTFQTHVAMRRGERRGSDGDLYSYEAIQEGQLFLGELSFTTVRDAIEMLSLFDESESECGFEAELRLGKGSTRGYGLTRWLLQPEKPNPHCPLPISQRVTSISEPITLTFLSDTILYDPWGRLADLSSSFLSEYLGIRLSIVNSFIAQKEIDGFHGAAGLPRFRDMAIRAGSTIGFVLDSDIDLGRLQRKLDELESTGLGLRKNEGFGLVAFNHVIYRPNLLSDIQPIVLPEHWAHASLPVDLWDRHLNRLLRLRLASPTSMNRKQANRAREIARWVLSYAHSPVDELLQDLKRFGELEPLQTFNIRPRQSPNSLADLRVHLVRDVQMLQMVMGDAGLPDDSYVHQELWRRSLVWFGDQLVAAKTHAREEAKQ